MHQADHLLCHDVPNDEYKFCLENPYSSPLLSPEKHTDAVKGMYSPFRLSQPPVCSYSFVNDLWGAIVNSRKEPSMPHPRHENETTTLQLYGAVKDIISVSEAPKHTGILLFFCEKFPKLFTVSRTKFPFHNSKLFSKLARDYLNAPKICKDLIHRFTSGDSVHGQTFCFLIFNHGTI